MIAFRQSLALMEGHGYVCVCSRSLSTGRHCPEFTGRRPKCDDVIGGAGVISPTEYDDGFVFGIIYGIAVWYSEDPFR